MNCQFANECWQFERALLVVTSRLGLVKQTALGSGAHTGWWGSFAPSAPGHAPCLPPNSHPSLAAAVHGGSPGGYLVQHGPHESARLRPQGGFPDEHVGRGKGRARASSQAAAWAVLSGPWELLEAGFQEGAGRRRCRPQGSVFEEEIRLGLEGLQEAGGLGGEMEAPAGCVKGGGGWNL